MLALRHCALQRGSIQIDRCLATVPLLQECLTKEKLVVIRGKRFNLSKFVNVALIYIPF